MDTVFLQRYLGESSGALYEYHWLTAVLRDVPRREPRSVSAVLRAADAGDPLDLRSLRSDSRAVPHHQLRAGRLVSRCGQRAARSRVDAAADRRRSVHGRVGRHPRLRGHEQLLSVSPGRVRARPASCPWDADHTFHAADYPLLAGAAENVLMRRMLEDPVLRARYFQLVLEAVNAASSRRLAGARGHQRLPADSRLGARRSAQAVHDRGVRRGVRRAAERSRGRVRRSSHHRSSRTE